MLARSAVLQTKSHAGVSAVYLSGLKIRGLAGLKYSKAAFMRRHNALILLIDRGF
jgi:hypothetical protein